jgi:hypothetical protein
MFEKGVQQVFHSGQNKRKFENGICFFSFSGFDATPT